MADEKVGPKADEKTLKLTRDMISVWASTLDALLQQWYECGKNEDRLGMALTSVRLAQVGHMLTAYFKDVGQEFINGKTELKAAREAISHADYQLRKQLADVGIGEQPKRPAPVVMERDDGEQPARIVGQAPAKKDTSLN